MKRRAFLSSLAVAAAGKLPALDAASAASMPSQLTWRRVRPTDAAWPSAASWSRLNESVGGQLIRVQALFQGCASDRSAAACAEAHKNIANPFWLGDQPGGTEISGWLDAWTPAPSAYAVKARDAGRRRRRRRISPATTGCAWWSRAAAIATWAPRTRPTRC